MDTESETKPHVWRIGNIVRCIVPDVFIHAGLEGTVVNVAPPRRFCPPRLRVLWDNETVCMIDATSVEFTGKNFGQE